MYSSCQKNLPVFIYSSEKSIVVQEEHLVPEEEHLVPEKTLNIDLTMKA